MGHRRRAAVLTGIGILTPLATAGTLPAASRMLQSSLPLDTARERGLAVWNALPAGLRGVETAANAASPSATGEGAGFSFLSTIIQSIASDPEPFVVAGLALVALWTVWRGHAIRFLPGWAGVAALLVHLASIADIEGSPNALFLAVAFMTVAAAESVRYRPLVLSLSLILAVSLIGYSGIDGAGLPVAVSWTLEPAAVRLASCLVLLWHAWVFNSECARETPRLRIRAQEARQALASRSHW